VVIKKLNSIGIIELENAPKYTDFPGGQIKEEGACFLKFFLESSESLKAASDWHRRE